MHFPVDLVIGSLRLPSHPMCEVLAYSGGFQLYRWQRRRRGDALDTPMRWSVIAAAIAGAAIGARVLCWFVDPALTLAHWQDPAFLLFGGKTIVGGLAGGLLAVELTKWRLGIRQATGDLYAVPLAFGVAVGRIGCFLTGLSDRTYGVATTWPWGVDFGDGVTRHPTQLYESAFGLLLGLYLFWRSQRPYEDGALFRTFLASYMAFRLGVEFLKPGVPLGGLTAIQWTCLFVLLYYAVAWARRPSPSPVAPTA